MTGTLDFETRQTIRENRQIIRHVQLHLAMTLNTREQLSRDCLQKRVHELERRLNKKIFGRNWRQKKKKINWIHNYEHSSGNSHSHSVCSFEGVEAVVVKRHARQIWANLNKGKSQAQLWADTITNPNATAIYVTKDGDMDMTPV